MKPRLLIISVVLALIAIACYFYLSRGIAQKNTSSGSQHSTDMATSNGVKMECSGKQIPELTEGPNYKAGSPEKSVIVSENVPGTKIVLTGYVLDTNCNPIAHALLDFWQADGDGIYDNEGYALRGHQYTDGNGRYMLSTVIPGEYPGRTPHIHVKVKANEKSPVVTTQLFLPNQVGNNTDTIFDQSLVVQINDDESKKTAKYNFVISAE
jgi:protocatechuate 3,4-dioxygenase beta subunit